MTAGEKFLADYERTVANIKAARAAREKVRDAAPELLAALKQIVADWENVAPGKDDPFAQYVQAHWDAARAVIAKAGEWPAEEEGR